MIDRVVAWLQLLIMLALCAIVGTPQTAFSSIEHFMLNEHIYEDRCRVLFEFDSDKAVYCIESRTAYTNVYNQAGLGFAIALLPALFSSQYLGFSVTDLFSCMALGAGSMIITSRPEDQWLNDRMAYGYAFVACAGPFAILNALNMIAFLATTKRLLICLLLTLFATLQLSPFIWAGFSWQFSNIDLTVSDLFQSLLWVPSIFMIVALVTMPLTVSPQDFDFEKFVKELKPHFLFKTTGPFAELEGFQRDVQYFESEIEPDRPYLRDNILSRPFIALLIAYTLNSMSMDLMYLGGEAKAIYHKELTVSAELTGWSPLIAALLSPIFLVVNMKWGLVNGAILSSALSLAVTAGQFLSNRAAWLITSAAIGSVQVALIWNTVLCLLKIVDSQWSGISIAAFLISSTLFKIWVLPIVEAATEFGTRILGFNAYLVVFAAQLLSSWYAIRILKKQSHEECRWILELEAEQAFS